jgi:hypothetical protein
VGGVAPTTAEVRMAAEMPTTMTATTEMCATMTTAVMTTAVATTAMTATSMTATATFRSGITSGRQHGRENNDGDPDIEF